MDHYLIWFDLKDSGKDLEFSQAVTAFLSGLQDEGRIESFRLTRRKLGFGPNELGEFMLDVQTKNLAQLEEAFDRVARRTGQTEKDHANVWSRVSNFRSGLFRDFPDPQRGQS